MIELRDPEVVERVDHLLPDPEGPLYLASGWSEGVGRYSFGTTPENAVRNWRASWGRRPALDPRYGSP